MIGDWWGTRVRRVVTAAFVAAVCVSYVAAYSQVEFGTISEGVRTPGFAELVSFIDAHTAPDDVFIFQNPRVLCLFTRRRAAVYPAERTSDGAFWQSIERIGARYVIYSPLFPRDERVLMPALESATDCLEPVYRNENFTLYRIREYPRFPAS